MNVQSLERLIRDALRGDNLSAAATACAAEGSINPVEHRSLTSLAQQISNNLRSGNTELNDVATPVPELTWV